MASSGKELEQLVKVVEEIFLPKGFEVTLRDKVFNDDGIQVAELDVLIKGRLSTSFTWLIECRDRPSEGAAPASWIEQLVGRRERFQLDKVIAVSTTGFSPGASEYAEKAGIETRTIGNITKEEISSWLLAEGMQFDHRRGELIHVEVILSETSEEQFKQIEKKLNDLGMNAPILTHTGTGEKLSMINAYQDAMNQNPQLFNSIEPNTNPIRRTIVVDYINPDSRYMFSLDDGNVHITKAAFVGDLTIESSFIPFTRLTRYKIDNTDDTIAESAHVILKIEKDDIDLGIHKVIKQDGTRILLTKAKTSQGDENKD